ncbi:hypothetical protein N3K66_003476 [Trichothecium roseum]|uniref:Uncharacterized protein n=1 Tax=Trichothecium roseum TaxID=47278 RepID=A0ACC0V5G7_9HYPO|nr:hypothetical protein N3K66_003476 [Trichothecium roseum]
MATAAETNKGNRDSGPESPTTARPFEIDEDDDEVQETGVISDENPTKTSSTTPPAPDAGSTMAAANTTNTTTPNIAATEDETPPVKPPRPMTEAQKNEAILKEAFPAVEEGVIKAILRASGGRVEPAFNALLEMTDPDAVKNEPEPAAPPQPPRPQGRQLSQMEADERYARQLAEHYDNVGAYENRTSNQRGNAGPQRPIYDEDDRDHSFLDDDLPVIRENLRKGFMETQTKVNGWINTLKKRIEENFDESEDPNDRYGGQPGHYGRQGETSRRSGDYDADPQVLSDDFAGMRFTADGTPAHRASSINTNVYRPPSTSPRPSANGRRVGFKEETEEINMYDASPQVPPKDKPPAGTKSSKWQPLSTVEPSPITDNDPFSLGDSEDEKEVKDTKEVKDKPKEVSQDEQLKQATADAMADSLVDAKKDAESSSKA